MRIPFAVLPLLAALAPSALAYVEFVSPAAGGSLPAGAISVKWKDNGDSPKISQLDTYTLDVVLGGNEAGPDTVVFPLTADGDFSDGNSYTGTLTPTQAASTKNGFYLRMTSTGDGGTIINYSDRFTVTGMTGVTPPDAAAAVPGGTSGPPMENNFVAGAAGGQQAGNIAGAEVPAAGDYGIPFNKQGGTIKYAPMQPFPPTKMTAKGKPTPQFPTSAYTIATGKMPPPTVISTITQSQTRHAMTMENTVAPQAGPKDDMAKFLARWKD